MAKASVNKRKPGQKMDRHLVSNQQWELEYIAHKFGVRVLDVKSAKSNVGKSRRKVYSWIRANL